MVALTNKVNLFSRLPNIATFMSSHWKAGCAFIYTMVILFDTIMLPFYYENKPVVLSPIEVQLISRLQPSDAVNYLNSKKIKYEMVTMDISSPIHYVFGFLLTASAVGRRGKKDEL